MNGYIIRAEDRESLEQLLGREDITITYRARHIPFVMCTSELPYEDLQSLLPEYEITEQKRYRIPDDTQP